MPRGSTPANASWIEVRLTDTEDGQTRLELEQIAPDDDQTWAEFGPGAVGVGWDLALMSLELPDIDDPRAQAVRHTTTGT